MAGKLSGGANCVRAVFIIFNVLFSIVGAIVLALGIYLAVEGETYSFITGSEITSGAGLLIASGAITFCIAAVGFIGACFKLRPLLVVFAIVLILIVLLEIAAAIVGTVHYSQSDLESQYSESWQDALTDYRFNSESEGYQEDVNTAVDNLQETLECCGASEPSDWGVYNPNVLNDLGQKLPDSCNCTPGDDVTNCSTVAFTYQSDGTNVTRAINQVAWTVGCVNATIDAAEALFVVAIATGFVVGILEIFGIIISLSLVCCITNSLKKEII